MTTKMIRNASALLGLSTMMLFASCSQNGSSGTTETTVKPASATTETPKPATPPVAATAEKPAEPAPTIPKVIHARAPDGREYEVDLSDRAPEPAPAGSAPATPPAAEPATKTSINGAAPNTAATGDAASARAASERPALQQPAEQMQPVPMGPAVVVVEPATLELGEVPTGDQVTGTVKLRNTGDKPMKVIDCTSSCGCTAAKCPKGQLIPPGETSDVEIKVSPGFIGNHPINKVVTIKIEGQPDIALPVNAMVKAYIVTEPEEIDLEDTEHRTIKIKSVDEVAFTLTGVVPSVIDDLGKEAKTVHEFTISEESWKTLARRPKMVFNTDHPKSPQVYVRFKPQVKPPVAQPDQIAGDETLRTPPPTRGPRQPTQAPIHTAASRGDVAALLTELQAEGAVVDQRDGGSATPLMLAAKGGHVECMELLLKYGADVEVADKVGMTALSHAAQANSLPAVRLLLDHHAEANTHDEIGTPLIWATGPKGSNEVVKELIAAKADVNAAGILNMTPMIWATGFSGTDRQPQDVTEVVGILIKAGADLEKAGGPEQMTPLLYAVQRTTPQTVTLLLDAGADVKAQDSMKRGVLDLARSRKDEDGAAILKILETKMGVQASDAPAAPAPAPAPKPGN